MYRGLLLRDGCLAISINTEHTDMLHEGANTHLRLSCCRIGNDILKKLDLSRSAFAAGIAHLSHLFHELSNGLALLERTAFFECGALAGDAFVLLNQRGIWADSLAESRTLEHNIV